MSESGKTGTAWVERFNLEDMVSRAIDKKFNRFTEDKEETTNMDIEFATNPNEDLSPEASQILHIIRESAEPVGRANILSRTSVPAHKWTLAIQELKDQDYVVQHGSRRGAKYTIA
jgi:hypothetical protein